MHTVYHIPYVGIKASEMIEKLDLDFFFTGEHLSVKDKFSGNCFRANEFEKRLYFQSINEKHNNE